MFSLRHRILLFLLPILIGCGATKQHTVTEQLLSSDAVDRAVSQIDFSVLKGRKVFLDTNYVQPIKNIGFVNDRYILSSLRQQMAAAGCLLQDSAAEADVVVEPRVGALGTDMHEVVYGLPANNLLANVANLAPNTPQLPTIPEIAVAKKHQHLGAAKLAVFAYERDSRDPIWQSGVAQAESTARDVWVLGAGPFQNGSIYDRTYFAGTEINVPLVHEHEEIAEEAAVGFDEAHVFLDPLPKRDAEGEVQLAVNEQAVAGDSQADSDDASVAPASLETPVTEPAPIEVAATKSDSPKEPAEQPAPAEEVAAGSGPANNPAAQPVTLSPEPASQVQAPTSPATAEAAPQAEIPADKRLSEAIIEHFERTNLSPGWPINPWYNPSPRFSIVE